MAGELLVWLYGLPVAVISRHRGQLRLTYTAEALQAYELGTPLLSLSLPLRPERYTHLPVKAFIDGLLPEGQSRETIARNFAVMVWDSYRLIEVLGRDCAGAVVIQPEAEPPPPATIAASAKALSDEELQGLVSNLRNAPLGAGGLVRISLAGIQEKLVLAQIPGAGWGQPIDGTPSTHILKPEIVQYPSTVENEAFCMRVARNLGLRVANVDTTRIGAQRLIVVERYDRIIKPGGEVMRVHQEDFCQATSVLPVQKYEQDGGPSLKRIANILQAFAALGSTEELLRAVTLNVILGNGDAHAKNFSILHEPSGDMRLAPLYDLMSTLFYGDNQLAMFIDNVHRFDAVTVARIRNEAVTWGMSQDRASDVIHELLDEAPRAIDMAQSETQALPDEIPGLVKSQLHRLRER